MSQMKCRGRHSRPPTAEEEGLILAVDRGFREIYYTLISIIQGVAFGFLAERAFSAHRTTTEQWIAFAICFMAITVVWHEYMVGSTIFTWTPTLFDSAIPFAIGMAEFQLVAGVQLSAISFLTRLAAFLAIGTAAYLNWIFHARHGKVNQVRYETLKSYIKFGTAYCATTTAATLFLARGLATDIGFSGTPLLATTLGMVAPLFLHSAINWNVKLHLIRTLMRRQEEAHLHTPSV